MRRTSLAMTIRVSRRATRPPAAMDAAESSARVGEAANKAIPAQKINAQRTVFRCMAASIAARPKPRQRKKLGFRENLEGLQVVEFPWTSLYSENATRLSAGFFRVRTGWRRDEWAESPLFICGKSCPKTLKNQGNTGVMAAGKAAGTMAVGTWLAGRNPEGGGTGSCLAWARRGRHRVRRAGQGSHSSSDLEKNAEGRAQLKAAAEAGAEGLPERLLEGTLAVEQLSGVTHEDCAAVQPRFWSFARRGGPDSRRVVHAGSQFSRT